MITTPESLKPYLTARQLEVVELLNMGYDRQGVADSLMPAVCIQAVHQIVLRIRKRIQEKTGIKVRMKEKPVAYAQQ